jgi:cardiolipin synthase
MKFRFEIGDLFKIPNILCYLRILMVPLFLYIYFTADTNEDYYFATGVVMISGLTDFLDGQIARRCNMITDIGRIIDPVADKLMQLAMLVALTFKIKYMYLLVIYLVVKEITMAIMGFIVMQTQHRRLNGAKWYGKVCTAILYIVMLVLVAFPMIDPVTQQILLIVCAGGLTLSFVMYIRIYVIMIVDGKAGRDDKVLY